MSRLLEASLFLSLAAALHVGAFAVTGADGDGSGGGSEGEAVVTLSAAPASMAELVQDWQRPPDAGPAPEIPQQPDIPEAVQPVPVPVQDTVPKMADPVQLAALPPVPVAPRVETRLPARRPVSDQPPDQPRIDTPDRASALRSAPDRPRRTLQPDRPAVPPAPVQPVADIPAKPSPKPRPPALSQPARKAAGTGNAPVAGQAQPKPRAATLSAGQRNALLADWGGQIKRKVLRRKRYPRGTTATGTASLRVTVSRDGQLAGLTLRKSSGSAALDKAALQAVQRAGRFPKAPKGLDKSSYSFTLALTFSR